MITFLPGRAPEQIIMCRGPFEIRRHALERFHQRTGVVDQYEAWSAEFRPTLQAALALAGDKTFWMPELSDGLLPTENGALLGVFENGRFFGRTWLHTVDLDVEKHAAMQRIKARMDQERPASVDHWNALLKFWEHPDALADRQQYAARRGRISGDST